MKKIEPSSSKGDGHPIPLEKIHNIDVLSERTDGKGVNLSIIAAGYLDNSVFL